MPRKPKDIGVKIKFDDKEYTKEEMEFYIQRFFDILCDMKGLKNPPQFIGRSIVEAISEVEARKEIFRLTFSLIYNSIDIELYY